MDAQEPKKILFVLTSHERLGDTRQKTGFHFSEMAEPFYILQDNGVVVELASIKGGKASADPSSVDDDPDENPESVRRFLNDKEAIKKLNATHKVESISMGNYAGVYMPGGHGTMWDFPQNEALKNIIESAWESKKVIAAVCHGPAGFVNVSDENGEPLVKGKRVNCFTDEEEKKSGKDKVVPFLLESKLRSLGAHIEKAPPFEAYLVEDGLLITGQNPKSAPLVANAILHALHICPHHKEEESIMVSPHVQRDYLNEALRREAVGVFVDQAKLDATIAELEGIAFPRHDISILSNNAKVEKEIGEFVSSAKQLEDHPDAPRSISIRPEEKTIGASVLIGCCAYICGTFFAITSGADTSIELVSSITGGSILGALIGTIITFLVWKKYSAVLKRQIEKGGLILWVRTPDAKREKLAQEIMRKNGGRHVHVHNIV